MNYVNRFLTPVLAGTLLLLSEGFLSASPLTLAVTPVASDGACRFQLQGEPGVHYVLEQSNDLSLWEEERGVQAPASGLVEWASAVGQEPVVRFYRARVEDPAEVPASVTAQLDVELSVQGMATQNGGGLSLLDHDGTVYTLSIPANAVVEPVLISMTIVTNLIGHPLAAADWRAVVFEPRGLEFDLPATLQVDLPEGTPMSERVSFWFASEGADFGLVPDQMSSNTVVLPVYHFCGYGSGSANGQSLAGQMRRRVADPFQRLTQKIAGEIATERRADRMPQDSSQLPVGSEARIAQAAADLIRRQFPNHGLEISSSCGAASRALGRVGWLLGLGKTFGLKSGVYVDAAEKLRSAACVGVARCDFLYEKECNSGDPTAYSRYVKLKARHIAMGIACVSNDGFEPIMKKCRQGWNGTALTAHKAGSATKPVNQAFHKSYETNSLSWDFIGDAVNVIDQRTIPGSSLSLFRAEFTGVFCATWNYVKQDITWGCEGGVDRENALRERMSIISGALRTNITVNLLIRITPGFDTNVTVTTIPAMFNLPIKSREFVRLGQEWQNEWTDGDDAPLLFMLDRMATPNPVLNLNTNSVTINWFAPISPAGSGAWAWSLEKILGP